MSYKELTNEDILGVKTQRANRERALEHYRDQARLMLWPELIAALQYVQNSTKPGGQWQSPELLSFITALLVNMGQLE